MTHVITQSCCSDASCVPVCPVNCIHPTPDEPDYATAEMLYIDPDSCIDCGACVDACPISAIAPDFDLAPDDAPFLELNAQYYRDASHQGYDPTPAVTTRSTCIWPTEQLRVAVVGSGPAACYAVEDLLGRRALDVRVDVFERLAVPGGLVRFGVAPDHQGTKAIGDGFGRTLRHRNVRLFLGIDVGTAITHQDLSTRYHAVIYAVGAMGDRRLGIAGEDLPGSRSAAEFVAWYNGHPDFSDLTFDLSSERAVIIGNGNVALDVARVLLADVDSLRRTDIADHALEQFAASRIQEVAVIGRRGPAQAAFTTPELLGLARTPGIDLRVVPDEVGTDPATRAWSVGREDHVDLYKADLVGLLRNRAGAAAATRSRRALLRFALSPVELLGDRRVEGVRLAHNELVLEGGAVVARPTEQFEELSAGLVLRSVGYRGIAVPGLPFNSDRGVLPNDGGRVVDPHTGLPLGGVYAAGWAKRGPSGVIGTNKRCSRQTVDAVLADWTAGDLTATTSQDILPLVPDHLDLAAWASIDASERAEGRAAARPRVKLVRTSDMVAVARAARATVT